MAGFRLKMATQLGEKVAQDHGFTNFPISPAEIAKAKGITVEAKPAEIKGISGALIFAGNDVRLIYSTEYNNAGFERFSMAHELGHYFLPGHPEEIINDGGSHVSRSNFVENSSIELEADHFASGLLMPSHLVRDCLNKNGIGLDGIIALADAAECSRTAAAIRAAECSEYPMAIIVSQGDQISYCFMSDGFKGLGRLSFLRKSSPLPFGTTTRTFNTKQDNISNASRVCGETTLADWFDGSGQVKLDEEVMGLGNYGYTLTVLSSEKIQADAEDGDEDEDNLEERWTPRFAYGR